MPTPNSLSLASCSHFVFTAFPYENLGDRGFTLSPQLDREEDGVIVQTLEIYSEKQTSIGLEFKEIVDEEVFAKSWASGKLQVRGREVLRPSLRFWGENTVDQVCGSIPIRIEKGEPAARQKISHSNSVYQLYGIYLGLDEKGVLQWSEFLGEPPKDSQWMLKDGTRIIIADRADGLHDFMERRKDFPFWGVILKSASYSEFKVQAEPEVELQWCKQNIAVIKEHLTDWDLLVL